MFDLEESNWTQHSYVTHIHRDMYATQPAWNDVINLHIKLDIHAGINAGTGWHRQTWQKHTHVLTKNVHTQPCLSYTHIYTSHHIRKYKYVRWIARKNWNHAIYLHVQVLRTCGLQYAQRYQNIFICTQQRSKAPQDKTQDQLGKVVHCNTGKP